MEKYYIAYFDNSTKAGILIFKYKVLTDKSIYRAKKYIRLQLRKTIRAKDPLRKSNYMKIDIAFQKVPKRLWHVGVFSLNEVKSKNYYVSKKILKSIGVYRKTLWKYKDIDT